MYFSIHIHSLTHSLTYTGMQIVRQSQKTMMYVLPV